MSITFEDLSSTEQVAHLNKVAADIYIIEKEMGNQAKILDISHSRYQNGQEVYTVEFEKTNGKGPNDTSRFHYYVVQNGELVKDENPLQNINPDQYNSISVDNGDQLKADLEKAQEAFDANKITFSELQKSQQAIMALAMQMGIPLNTLLQQSDVIVSIKGNSSVPSTTDEKANEVEQASKLLGVDDAKQDSNGNLGLNVSAIDNSSLSSKPIDGSEKVTLHETFNDFIGCNYESYRIIKTSAGQSLLIGVTADGVANIVSKTNVEFDQTTRKTLPLMQDNNNIIQVGLVASFDIKPHTESGPRRSIGIYNNNGKIGAFCGRNDHDQMIAEPLPCTAYNPKRVHSKAILDRTNRDTSPEAQSAARRVDDNKISNTQTLGDGQNLTPMSYEDSEKLLDRYSTQKGLDREILKSRYNQRLLNNPEGLTDEQLIAEEANLMEQEKNKAGYDHPLPGERSYDNILPTQPPSFF